MKIKQFPVVLSSKKSYIQRIVDTNPIVYFPMNETSGTAVVNYGTLGSSANGTYSGVTLASALAPGGTIAPSFDGVNDLCNIYSAVLNTNFNGRLGSLGVWWKVFDASVWADVTNRTVLRLQVDANNYISPTKYFVNNTFRYIYTAGGDAEVIATLAHANTSWNYSVMTWSDAADQLLLYVNGSKLEPTITAIGQWSNGALDTDKCVIASNAVGVPSACWKGWIAHCAIWARVLSPTEIAALYSRGL